MKTRVHKLTLTTVALVAANGLLGCAASDEPSTATSGESSSAEIVSDDSLANNIATIRALQIFEVSSLQENVAESSNCYNRVETSIGLACPQDLGELAPQIQQGDNRVASFAYTAQEAAEHAPAHPEFVYGPASVAADLEALRNMHIVEVGAFILDQPEQGNCYQLFCQESNQVRAGKLHRLAAVTFPPAP